MELKELGEFGLIDLVMADTIVDASSVVVGIGDDAAAILPEPKRLQLLTTDMLVENVHFKLGTTTPWQLGYKAVAVNLSDIAAMGGAPKHALVSIGLRPDISVEFVLDLYKGMKEICRSHNVNIVGGDTVSSPCGLVINVALTGDVEPGNLVRRSGAQVGDLVVVTGTLGASGAGLGLLMQGGWQNLDFAWPLVNAHLTPQPQVQVGQTLARMGATSMDDISDGLASELNEISRASGVGIKVYADRIPLSQELLKAAKFLQKPPLDLALFAGEDFQLVATMPAKKLEMLNNLNLGVPLTIIGEVSDNKSRVTLVDKSGSEMILEAQGYNHFR